MSSYVGGNVPYQQDVRANDDGNKEPARARGEKGKGSGNSTKRVRLPDEDNKENEDPTPHVVERLDEGATRLSPDIEDSHQHGDELDDGDAASVQFPILDIEPNTVTSRNVDEPQLFMKPLRSKPRIDFKQLAYESVVGRLQGHKKAYNSQSYGVLEPSYTLKTAAKDTNKEVYVMDSESLMDSLAEAPFGLMKRNEALADTFKRDQRTFVLTTSADHGGPSMYRRGLNQYRNKAIKHMVTDPQPESVDVQKQVARDGMRLNQIDLYPSEHTRVRFKSRYNQNRGAERDGAQFAAAGGAGGINNGLLSGETAFSKSGVMGVTENVPQNSLVGYAVNPGISTPFSVNTSGVTPQAT